VLNGHTSQKAATTDTRPGAGGRAGWGQAISSLAFGAAAALLFARRQVTAAEPLIRPTLLANRGFTSALLLGLAYFAVVNGILYVILLFLQQAIGYTPGSAALRLVPLTVGLMVGAGACMGLLQKIGRLLVPVGLVLTAAGSGWLLAAVHAHGADLGGWTLGLSVFVIGMGMAPVSAPSTTSPSVTSTPPRPVAPAAQEPADGEVQPCADEQERCQGAEGGEAPEHGGDSLPDDVPDAAWTRNEPR
jgi:hypothetical protein